VPLSSAQRKILGILAARRSPASHVAGGLAINRRGPRFSNDIDFFHDDPAAVAREAEADAALLRQSGYDVRWVRRSPSMITAIVASGEDSTRLDWAQDSAFRFYPPQIDAEFGYVLHPIDIATNKALAAAGRRESRDVIDLMDIHVSEFPLSVVIWAAVAKDAGYSPESLIREMRRNAHYRQEDFDALDSNALFDAAEILPAFRAALDDAEAFAARMPSRFAGLLYLDNDKIVEPDPEALARYTIRQASKGGVWPTPGAL
jgi:hypothetical protein